MAQSILGRYQAFYGTVCIDTSRQSQTKSEPEGSRPSYHTVMTRSVQNLITSIQATRPSRKELTPWNINLERWESVMDMVGRLRSCFLMTWLETGERKPSDMVMSRGIDDSRVAKHPGWELWDGGIHWIVRLTRRSVIRVVRDGCALVIWRCCNCRKSPPMAMITLEELVIGVAREIQ